MKSLILACVLLCACTGVADQRARTVSVDSEKCHEFHGDDATSSEYLDCMENLALERTEQRRIEEARRAAQDATRVHLPTLDSLRSVRF